MQIGAGLLAADHRRARGPSRRAARRGVPAARHLRPRRARTSLVFPHDHRQAPRLRGAPPAARRRRRRPGGSGALPRGRAGGAGLPAGALDQRPPRARRRHHHLRRAPDAEGDDHRGRLGAPRRRDDRPHPPRRGTGACRADLQTIAPAAPGHRHRPLRYHPCAPPPRRRRHGPVARAAARPPSGGGQCGARGNGGRRIPGRHPDPRHRSTRVLLGSDRGDVRGERRARDRRHRHWAGPTTARRRGSWPGGPRRPRKSTSARFRRRSGSRSTAASPTPRAATPDRRRWRGCISAATPTGCCADSAGSGRAPTATRCSRGRNRWAG